jgi:hypothetical protein
LSVVLVAVDQFMRQDTGDFMVDAGRLDGCYVLQGEVDFLVMLRVELGACCVGYAV